MYLLKNKQHQAVENESRERSDAYEKLKFYGRIDI